MGRRRRSVGRGSFDRHRLGRFGLNLRPRGPQAPGDAGQQLTTMGKPYKRRSRTARCPPTHIGGDVFDLWLGPADYANDPEWLMQEGVCTPASTTLVAR